ncbi:hypothetical protein AB0M19_06990 [Streptomyces sp. NPDC051920]|uniref:DUF4760 domain-containing protein n=1 Tax=Streptomyces sp. NPDC051920 TaxID=3155523 RepID=UPI00342E712F
MSENLNVVSLVVSLVAVLISVVSARQQASDTRRSNLLLFVSEMDKTSRSPAFLESKDWILNSLADHDPALGVTGLPRPAREHIYLVGGFYQQLGALVVTGVIDEDAAVAMHYHGIKVTWRALDPYVRAERERREAMGGGGFYGSFEHLAVYVENTPHAVIGARFPRRKFATPAD